MKVIKNQWWKTSYKLETKHGSIVLRISTKKTDTKVVNKIKKENNEIIDFQIKVPIYDPEMVSIWFIELKIFIFIFMVKDERGEKKSFLVDLI